LHRRTNPHCWENERESGNNAVISPWLEGIPALLCRSQKSVDSPDRGAFAELRQDAPESGIWHAKCFETPGRSWPGTMWGNPSSRFPTLRK
jgi:hypothetical protein